jgi:hypothetical protein
MSFLDTIKAKVGAETYRHIENVADKEVALAMEMPLRDQYHQEKYYQPRVLLGELLSDFELFERVGLKIAPFDVVDILFKCKLLRASQTQHEFGQRCGGLFPILVDPALVVRWEEKAEGLDAVVDRHITQLEAAIKERVLLAPISSFTGLKGDAQPRAFFENLFVDAGPPFECFFEDDQLIEKHRLLEPGLPSYGAKQAEEFFSAPSLGFRSTGSRNYCFWYSTAWLRTFLNLLRIGAYIYPGQIEFGMSDIKMMPPTFPVFLGEHAGEALRWDEDKRESWAKIPDGCLFRSFGYRGLAKSWFDRRTFPGLVKFFQSHKRILECLKNPWNSRSIRDVAPALDILSSATQIPDVGAKILLIYCCLEHLFVPKKAKTENTKYIVGAMNALAPDLLTWFDNLYDLRCDYAHKGFVLRDDRTLGLVMDSVKNAMALLLAKLSAS